MMGKKNICCIGMQNDTNNFLLDMKSCFSLAEREGKESSHLKREHFACSHSGKGLW